MEDITTTDLRGERAYLEAAHNELKAILAGLDTAAQAHFRELGQPCATGASCYAAARALPEELARLRLLIAELRDDRAPISARAQAPLAPAELASHLLRVAREGRSALHEAAARTLLRLIEDNARLREALHPLTELARKGSRDHAR